VRSAGAIATNSGFQSGSEYSRSQLETSAAQKDSFFARRLEVRACGGGQDPPPGGVLTATTCTALGAGARGGGRRGGGGVGLCCSQARLHPAVRAGPGRAAERPAGSVAAAVACGRPPVKTLSGWWCVLTLSKALALSRAGAGGA